MMNRVLRLGDRTVETLMTPRIRIVWLDAAASDEANLRTIRETPCSRYPVYRGSDAEVLGIFETKRLASRLDARKLDLTRDLRKALFVPNSSKITTLLDLFRDDGAALALVVDEYGDIHGMITVHDLLGAVMGRASAIDAAASSSASPVVRRADGSLLIDGSLPTDDLRELLALPALPGAEHGDYNTLAGFVMARFGRIPHTGESFDWQGWRFEVVDLDGARIDKLLLQKIAEAPPDAPESAD
jgi:putative hemolysin